MNKKAIVLIALLFVSLAPILVMPEPVLATTFFADDFESAFPGAWSGTQNSSGDPVGRQTTYKHHNSYGANFTIDGSAYSEYSRCYKLISPKQQFLYAIAYVWFNHIPNPDVTPGIYRYLNFMEFTAYTNTSIRVASAELVNMGSDNPIEPYRWRIQHYADGQINQQVYSEPVEVFEDKMYAVELYVTIGSGEDGIVALEVNNEAVVNATGFDNDDQGNIFRFNFGIVEENMIPGEPAQLYADCVALQTDIDEWEDGIYIGYTSPNTTLTGMPTSFEVLAITFPIVNSLSHYCFGTNNTGVWVNDTWTSCGGSYFALISAVKTLNDTLGIRVQWQFWINDTDGHVDTTGTRSLLTTTDAPTYHWIFVDKHQAGVNATFHVYWASAVGPPYSTVSHSIFSTNNTGTWANTTVYINSAMEWHNETITLNSTEGTVVSYLFIGNSSTNHITTTRTGNLVTMNSTYAEHALHIEKQTFKNDLGEEVRPLGFCKPRYAEDPTGWWPAVGEGDDGGYQNWRSEAVEAHLDALKITGATTIVLNVAIQYWKEDTLNHRQHIKELLAMLLERDMYLVYRPYVVQGGDTQETSGILPYPPYHSRTSIIADEDEFVDYWESIALELRYFPNVVFSMFNEAGGAYQMNGEVREHYFEVALNVTDAIRGACDNVLFVQWGYGAGPYFNLQVWIPTLRTYIDTEEVTNLAYVTHLYDAMYGGNLTQLWTTYVAIVARLTAIKLYWAVFDATQELPIVIEETGASYPYWGSWNTTLYVLNLWNVGYCGWWWRRAGVSYDLLASEPYMPTLRTSGLVLTDRMNDHPFAWSAGATTYIWDDSIGVTHTETWDEATQMLNVSFSYTGSMYLRIFWRSVPSDAYWYFLGERYDAIDYYSSSTYLITLPLTSSGNGSVIIGGEAFSPEVLNCTITNISVDDYCFAGENYAFVASFRDNNTYLELDNMRIRFSDNFNHTIEAYYVMADDEVTIYNGSDYVTLSMGTTESLTNTTFYVTFIFNFRDTIADSHDVSIWLWCNDTTGLSDGWDEVRPDYFNIFNKGGWTDYESWGDAGHIAGGDVFDLYAYNNSATQASIIFQNLQHVKMLPTFRFELLSVNPSRYLTYTLYYNKINTTAWVPAIRVRISWWNSSSNPNPRYTCFRLLWYNSLLEQVKEEYIFPFQYDEAYANTNQTVQFWVDLWINKINASSTAGGRVNAYYFPVQDNANPWLEWFTGSNYGLYERRKDSMFFTTITDESGYTVYAEQIHALKLVSYINQGIVTSTDPRFSVSDYNVFDLVFGSTPLTGIPTPVFDETRMPQLPQGGFLGALTGWLAGIQNAMKNWYWDVAAPNSFSKLIGFLDLIAGLVGFPTFFSDMLDFLAHLWVWFANSISQILILMTAFFTVIYSFLSKLFTVITQFATSISSIFTWIWVIIDGGLTGTMNLYTTLNLSSWLPIVPLAWVIYLIILWEEKGFEAVLDHLIMIKDILAFIGHGMLWVIEGFINIVSRIIEAIPVAE